MTYHPRKGEAYRNRVAKTIRRCSVRKGDRTASQDSSCMLAKCTSARRRNGLRMLLETNSEKCVALVQALMLPPIYCATPITATSIIFLTSNVLYRNQMDFERSRSQDSLRKRKTSQNHDLSSELDKKIADYGITPDQNTRIHHLAHGLTCT